MSQFSKEELLAEAKRRGLTTPDAPSFKRADIIAEAKRRGLPVAHGRVRADELEEYEDFKRNYSESVGAVLGGATSGTDDEIGARMEGSAGYVGALFDDRDAGKEYTRQSDKYLRFARQAQDDYAEEYPITSTALNIVGGIGTGVAGATTKAGAALAGRISQMGFVGRTASTAGLGAAGGAVAGFGEGEGGAAGRLRPALIGSAVGGLFGAAAAPIGDIIEWAGKRYGPRVAALFRQNKLYSPETGLTEQGAQTLGRLGYNPDEVSATFSQEFERQIADAVSPEQAARSASLREFDIPASRANITGTPEDFSFESSARKGAVGQGAGRVMRDFDAGQRVAIEGARDRIASDMGGGQVVGDATEAAGAALDKVRGQAAQAKATARAAYDRVNNMEASFDPDAARGVTGRIAQSLRDKNFIVDDGTPQAKRALQILDLAFSGPNIRKTTADQVDYAAARAAGLNPSRESGRAFSEEALDAIQFEQIESARKRIGKMYRAAVRTGQAEDAAALAIIRDGVDFEIDDALHKGLIYGDEEVIEAIKSARSLYAGYKSQFGGKKGADNFIRRMVEDDVGPRDVAGWLYGNSRVGSPRQSAQFASRLKDVLGEGDEWNAVRQGAWLRLVDGIEGGTGQGPQKTASAIRRFITGPERGLANTLFSKSERDRMLAFAKAMDTLTPPEGAINYSNTAESLRRSVTAIADTLITVKTGVPVVSSTLRDFANGMRAKAASRGIVPREKAAPGRVLGQIGAASAAGGGVADMSKSDQNR